MTDAPPYLVAFFLGLMGSTHCIGMCGGISSSLGLSFTESKAKSLLYACLFNAGRINSYLFAGLLVATLGMLIPDNSMQGEWIKTSRNLAAILLILMALYIGQWSMFIAKFEQLARPLWRRLEPLAKTLLPVHSPGQALGLGFLWGWIPCGLVYSTLAWSTLATDGIGVAWLMLMFGLGTAPAMIAAVFFANRLKHFLQKKGFRQSVATGLLLFAFWTLYAINIDSSHNHKHSGDITPMEEHPEVIRHETSPTEKPAQAMPHNHHHHE